MTNSKNPVKVGDKFPTKNCGEVTVISAESSTKITVMFSDGSSKVCSADKVRLGSIKNNYQKSVHGVGFIGEGKFRSYDKGSRKLTAEYHVWSNMLYRCYCPESFSKHPTYVGCSVSDGWLNFQAFAEWYVGQPTYGKGFQLDKDLTVLGNKVYSPDACRLIPKEVNCLLVSRANDRGAYPVGVCLDKRSGSFMAQINLSGTHVHLGTFATPEHAFNAYKIAKEAHVKEVANRHKHELTETIYNNLIAHTISITD